MAVVAGQNAASIQPAFIGFDRIDVPETRSAAALRWMQLLFPASTFRICGAYLQFQNARHWHDQIPALQSDGWGLGAIYLGFSRNSFVRTASDKSKHFDLPEQRRRDAEMTADAGRRHAAEARSLALSAHLRPGSVIWFDNEDPSGVIFNQQELDYYAAFFNEIALSGGDKKAFRPGLYAHQVIAAQLLLGRPDLLVWEVDYGGSNVNRNALPKQRAPTRDDPRFGLDPRSSDAAIKSFWVVPERPARPWTAWPVWRQFEGNNQGQIPPLAIGALTPLKNWDFNASLIRDPSNPVATPRLEGIRVAGTPFIARLDNLDPTWNANGRRQLPQRGWLRLYTVIPPVQMLAISPQVEWFLDPASPIVGIEKPRPEVVVLFTYGHFGSSVLSGSGWSLIQPLWKEDIIPGLRFPYAFAACQLGVDSHLFYVAEDARVWTSRRQNAHIWGDRKPSGGDLRVHPFARLTAALRTTNAVCVATFDTRGQLVALRWATTDTSWPADDFHLITADPLFPAGALASLSLGAGEILVIAIGTDFRPWRYILRQTRGGSGWSSGQALGRPEDLVTPHTQLGLERVNDNTVALFAMGSDGKPQRYLLMRGADWRADVRAPVLTQAMSGAFEPNPYSDLATVQTGGPQGIALAFAGVAPGAVAAFAMPGSGGAPLALPN